MSGSIVEEWLDFYARLEAWALAALASGRVDGPMPGPPAYGHGMHGLEEVVEAHRRAMGALRRARTVLV